MEKKEDGYEISFFFFLETRAFERYKIRVYHRKNRFFFFFLQSHDPRTHNEFIENFTKDSLFLSDPSSALANIFNIKLHSHRSETQVKHFSYVKNWKDQD